jgi:hypothetical protein
VHSNSQLELANPTVFGPAFKMDVYGTTEDVNNGIVTMVPVGSVYNESNKSMRVVFTPFDVAERTVRSPAHNC